jgi:hypothetical protein
VTRESPDQRAERILAELRAATSEAAGVLKDLRAAQKSAREQVDDYLGKGVQDALNFYKAEVERVGQHYMDLYKKDLTEHLTGWTAVVQNEISRTAIFKESVDAILNELLKRENMSARLSHQAPGEVVITMCERPHAD